jgi:hypothetical protein
LVKPIRAVSAVTWLSAPNAMVESEELAKWIDDYCHKNPTDNFYGAIAALIRKFRKIDSP